MHDNILSYLFMSIFFVVLNCSACSGNFLPTVVSEKYDAFKSNQSYSQDKSTNQKQTAPVEKVVIDADFPGGNIIVERIEGDTIFLRPDLRDTSTWWFYWYFRVRGAAGRTLKFQFTGNNPIGTQGPAFSTDGGGTWFWLGSRAIHDSSFTYEFEQKGQDVLFCFSIPYLEDNLMQFLHKYPNNSHLSVYELCKTRKSRSVERLHAGKINGNPKYRVLLTARHHACEMIASYTLEGLLEIILSDTNLGHWFQKNAEVLVVPFVDKDGVEDGDQGKNRRPHDHNRDYNNNSIYPSVKSIRSFVPQWSDSKLKVFIDLHCPYIRGDNNEVIYLVGSSDSAIWQQQQEFATILESVRQGQLPYLAKSSIPFGTAWNTAANYGQFKSSSRWAGEQSGVQMSTTIEIPYANVETTIVTADNARAFGHDLARALRCYLENSTE
ncbi:MAG: M14 family zinc carboxypeptidase [Sedimentisphaerales bacterium]|nr:M14 family zinc carboxypeptidase [Sedimentisphaerales bacterium]